MNSPIKSPGARQRSEADSHNHRPQLTASPTALLLPRLEGVITTGKGWRSMCPACGGRSRKLSVCEGDNGTLLVTCFSCHDTTAILAAVGLTIADLFPDRIRDHTPESRRAARQAFKQTAWAAALGVVGREAKVVSIAAHDLAAGLALNVADTERLALAIDRVDAAREVLV
jgi:hypothetical protein